MTAKPVRRIVAGEDGDGNAVIFSDGPVKDILTDPIRPGYSEARVWVTDGTPAPIAGIQETTDRPHAIEPPPQGSVCRVITFPPEASYIGSVKAEDVQNYFRMAGSPGASTFSREAPHPYMQKTRTLDFCLVLEGEITLVLDTAEVHLKRGDTVVQRGANHAWSNRSDKPAVVVFSLHDAAWS